MHNHERENYSWGVVQDMIEREVNSAFKLREPPPTRVQFLRTSHFRVLLTHRLLTPIQSHTHIMSVISVFAFATCRRLCAAKLLLVENHVLHTLPQYTNLGLSLVCVRMCLTRVPDSENPRPHVLHTKGFSLVCDRMCTLRFLAQLKQTPQVKHM